MAESSTLPSGFIYMTSEHSFRLTGDGRVLLFGPEKIVPVPKSLQAAALAHGAYPLDGEPAVATNDEPDVRKDPSSEEYRAAVRVAAESLLTSNQPADFGANGKPYVEAWERELGWKPIQSVRDAIWDEVRDEFRASGA